MMQKYSELMQKRYSDEPAMLKKQHMPLHMDDTDDWATLMAEYFSSSDEE